MVGVSRIEIRESTDQLKYLMHLQPRASAKERLQVLYLLNSLQAKDMSTAAQFIERDRTTVQRWLLKYEAHGIENLALLDRSMNCASALTLALSRGEREPEF